LPGGGSLGSLWLVGDITAISVVNRTIVANLLPVGSTIAGYGLGSTVARGAGCTIADAGVGRALLVLSLGASAAVSLSLAVATISTS